MTNTTTAENTGPDEPLAGPQTEPATPDTADTPKVSDTAIQRQDDADGSGDNDTEPRGRAAKYRQRAQESEAARDAAEQKATGLAGTIERLQRLHVEQAITAAGIKPAALWAVAELADLVDDDGLPDDAKIAAATKTARDQLGIKPPNLAGLRERGQLLSGAGAPQPRRDGWSAAFGRRDE
ncbi:MAG: hypothetical protein ACRDTV_15840 [Mycobacterium sp.]